MWEGGGDTCRQRNESCWQSSNYYRNEKISKRVFSQIGEGLDGCRGFRTQRNESCLKKSSKS